jgi:hypothetical protein
MSETPTPLLVGAQFLGLADDAKFQRQVLTDPYLQAAVYALGKVVIMGEVPEVEVTSSSSLMHAASPERPPERRRSGAKNVSDPHLQNVFISEARRSTGQPDVETVREFLGREVRLVFNVDWPPKLGTLTQIIDLPTAAPVYLVMDDDDSIRYPLYAVQSIELV